MLFKFFTSRILNLSASSMILKILLIWLTKYLLYGIYHLLGKELSSKITRQIQQNTVFQSGQQFFLKKGKA